jgi:hypothetical protein
MYTWYMGKTFFFKNLTCTHTHKKKESTMDSWEPLRLYQKVAKQYKLPLYQHEVDYPSTAFEILDDCIEMDIHDEIIASESHFMAALFSLSAHYGAEYMDEDRRELYVEMWCRLAHHVFHMKPDRENIRRSIGYRHTSKKFNCQYTRMESAQAFYSTYITYLALHPVIESRRFSNMIHMCLVYLCVVHMIVSDNFRGGNNHSEMLKVLADNMDTISWLQVYNDDAIYMYVKKHQLRTTTSSTDGTFKSFLHELIANSNDLVWTGTR